MKKTRLFLLGIALTALAGCALFSLNPFYTQENRIDVPMEVRGLWSGDDLHLKILPDGRVEYRSFSKGKTVELEFQVVFFKVADSLYADLSLVKPPPDIENAMLLGTLAPTHNVYQIKVDGDMLTILWPDFEKLRELCREGKVKLSYTVPSQEDAPPVFTASPREWERVFRNSSGAIFPKKNVIRFQRVLVQ